MDLTPEQRKNIKRSLAVARRKGASARPTKALLLAEGVEANYKDVPYGDRDSVGILQQRPSQGWGPASEPLEKDVAQFLERAMALNRRGFKGSAGQLAQAVQRSAFPDRYDKRSAEVAPFLAGMGGSSRGGDRSTTRTVGGVDNSALRGQAIAQFLGSKDADPVDFAMQVRSLQDVPGRQVTTPSREPRPTGSREGRSPLLEMFWQGPGGINVKNGQRVPQGFVSGHQDHVHVAAGPKTVVQLGELAQRMGLRVGENSRFTGQRETSGHAPKSYHYRDQAIDVSGDPARMRAFAKRVARLYGIR